MPREYFEWQLIWETGWTLDQVRAMSMQNYHNWQQVKDGIAKANK